MRKFGSKEVAKDMSNAAFLEDMASRAAKWLKGKAVWLLCDDL